MNLATLTMTPDATSTIPSSGANPMQQASDAMSLRKLALGNQVLQNQATTSNLETSDALATRDAVAKNTTMDPQTGQPVTNLDGTIQTLSKTSPSAALNFQLSLQQKRTEVAEKQAQLVATNLANTQNKVNLAGSLALGINSQEDLDRVRAASPKLGLDPALLPDKYDPKLIQQMRTQTMKASDIFNQKIETARLGLTATKQNADIQQMDATATNEIVGQYKDDPSSKEYINVANTYQSFKSMQSTPEFSTGLKDRDLLYNFQNIINPNRSATGGTIEQDEEARSLLGSIGVDIHKIIDGGTLTPSQRQQITAFAEAKFKDATLNQQVVFNKYQGRLQNMYANGRNVDPINSIPTYGATISDGKGGKKWVGVENMMAQSTQGQTIPQVNSSDLSESRGSGMNIGDSRGIPLPPAQGSAGEGLSGVQSERAATPTPNAKIATQTEVQALAAKKKMTVQQIKDLMKSKGWTVEGEQ